MTATTTSPTDENSIRPFHIGLPQEALEDMRRRIAATRWPERETVTDDSQGVPLATMQELARHWATDSAPTFVSTGCDHCPGFGAYPDHG